MIDLTQRQTLILNFPCFSHLTSEESLALANLMQEIRYKTGKVIVKENELVDAVYLIIKGTAEVTKDSQLLAALRTGEAIGLNELGFFSSTGIRTATVTAVTPMTILRLTLTDLNQFLQQHPQLNLSMTQAAKEMLQMQLIKQAVPFAKLSNERVHWIAQRVEEKNISPGDIIFNEGDVGDACYLIISGKIQIFTRDETGLEQELALLEKPALFGEVAAVTTATRNASARALTAANLLVLYKSDLLELVNHEAVTTDAITAMMIEHSRPLAKENITFHKRKTKEGDIVVILKNPAEGDYYQLSSEGWFIWQQLNGKQTLRDIATAFYKEFAVLAPESIYELIYDLVDNGFVINPILNTQLNQTKLSFWTRALLKIRNLMETQWALKNIDARLTDAYQKFFYVFFTKPALWLMSACVILGIISFITITKQAAADLHATHHFILLLIGCALLANSTIVLHEFAHAFTTKSYGREVNRIGVGWYWVGPIAFTDTSDMWLSERGPRTAVNIAGMYIDCLVGALVAIIAYFVPHGDIQVFLWLLALAQFLSVLKNLDPFLEYDGYYILMDLLDKPNLRESALLWLARPTEWRIHQVEIIYWSCCAGFLVLTASIAYLIQFFVIGAVATSHIFGIDTSHFRWLVPIAAVIVSSLGIYAQVRRRKKLVT